MKSEGSAAAVVLLCLALGCRGGQGAPAGNGQGEIPSTWTRPVIFFVFDPTVLAAGEEQKLEQWMARWRQFYKTIPMDSEAVVFSVGTEEPLKRYSYPLTNDYERQAKHEQDLERHTMELIPIMMGSWREAHAPGRERHAASCLLSALDEVMRFRSSFREEHDFMLVILSDMLESCARDGEKINVENGSGEIVKLREARLDLKGIRQLVVVEMPSHIERSRQSRAALAEAWHTVFQRAGLDAGAVVYAPEFPEVGLDAEESLMSSASTH
jgi:hypothetical protein